MRFWDASGLVGLVVEEVHTTDAQRVLREDREMIVWWGSAVECSSALSRLEREGVLSGTRLQRSRDALRELRSRWSEVEPSDRLRESAIRAVMRHPLRAADAFQLAAALEWVDGQPEGKGFCTVDGRLARAAHREGFSLPLATS